jgi:asparagine synthase (glutamine-hydrolysing)
MCGIAGHYTDSFDFLDIQHALSCFRHRGPDSSTVSDFFKVRLGYNRLAITDIDLGLQPIFNSDKSIVVFYNGEIYNHVQLRIDLQKRNHQCTRLVDGAILPYLYEIYGESYAEKLEGMYAIALYDIKQDKLILSRDIAGEKPLYFWQNSGEVIFSSSILAIKNLLRQEPTLDLQGLWDYPSFLWIPEPQTPFDSIASVMPGQTLIFENTSLVRTLNRTLLEPAIFSSSTNDLEQKLYQVIKRSVESMIPREVPFGAFLSSGLDSSIISTIIAEKQPRNSFDTFCIEFPDLVDPYHGFANESDLAFQYAQLLGSRHHTIKADSKSFLALLNDFVKFADSPFAVSSGLGVMMVAREAQSLGLKVLLSGDGADELYGGYSWYTSLTSLCNLYKSNQGEQKLKLDEVGITFQNRNMSQSTLVDILGKYSPPEMAFALHYYMIESEKKLLFSSMISGQVESSYRHMGLNYNGALEPLDFINHDRKFYLTQEMMRKLDRFTMSHSIEGRVPFVSSESIRFATQLSYEQLINGNVLKSSLRQTFNSHLPIEIIKRKKHGFNVPIDHWLKNDWLFLVETTFSKTSMLAELQIIDEKALDIALKMVFDSSKLHGHSIFSFIVLEKWLNYVYRGGL